MALDSRVIERLNKLYGIDRDIISDVNEYGELYECVRYGKHYILRISNYRTFIEQKAEVDFINYLYNNNVNVANVIPSRDGNLIETIELDNKELYVALFSKAIGHSVPSNKYSSDLLEKCGQIIGKMHRLSKEYSNSTKSYIVNWYEHNEANYLKYIPARNDLIIEKCNILFNKIKKLPQNKDTYGLIHSDIYGNFFIHNDKITIFDFQDCEHHYFINDLAIMIYFVIEDSFNGRDINSYSIEVINSLLEGYRKECDIEPFWIEKIPLFLKLREVLTFIIFHCYWDVDTFDEDRKARMNLYRKNIEYDIPVLNIDFSQFY